MPPQWRKKSDLEEKLPLITTPQEIQKDISIKIEFKDDDGYKRERELSKTEKMYKKLEEAAIDFTKFRLKLKEFWKTKIKKEASTRLAESEMELSAGEDRETFRRLITCVFSDKYLDEFISVYQALGFIDLGGFEYLGRRDADYSIAQDVDVLHRLHARIFRIKGNVFLLVHHEPKASEDIKLHIKGYFDRILNAIMQNKEKDGKLDIEGGSDGTNKIELSDYEKGSDLFLDILKERVPNFYQKITVDIGEEELELWRDHMGVIDHISPEDLIIENLQDSSRFVPPFTQIRDTIKKIFEYMHFTIEPAWDIKVPASDKYFIAKTTYAQKDYSILVITEDFIDDVMRIIGLLRARYHPKFVLLISPDIGLFGPAENDLPPKGIEIPPYNEKNVKELLQFLADSYISIMPVSMLIQMFERHLQTPFRFSHIAILLSHHGLLDADLFKEVFKEHDTYEEFLRDSMNVFEFFRQNPKKTDFLSLKQLHKMNKESEMELSETEIINIITLMESPLVDLIESKKGKREEYRLKQGLDEFQIDAKLKKLKKLIEENLVELA
jgi:hypothetical protein